METGKGADVFMVNHDILLKLKAKEQVADLSGLHTIPDYTDQMLTKIRERCIGFRLRYLRWDPTAMRIC